MGAKAEKTGPENTVHVSGKPGLIASFKSKALDLYGDRGVSRAACEAFTDWLAKQGVRYDAVRDMSAEGVRLRQLAALDAIGVDVDQLLERALEEAGSPTT